ncbi:MAG: fibronectin type III domain-containing protein [Planctomycetales bacterium]|nr:MAG: fibronectin type III domain-containing protein [Planctomycetales bacterium]
MTARLALLFCAMIALLAASCSGSAQQPMQEIDSPVTGPATGMESPGLPPLEALEAQRSISISGPGWHSIDPYYEGGQWNSLNAENLGGSLHLFGNGASAFIVYPVSGFGEDAFPTSLRTDASDDPVGEYFAIAADFQIGRWRVIGPFTDDATIEFPGLDEPGSQRRYLSPSGIAYVGLMLATNDSFDFSRIELGVDGGNSAPRPPTLVTLPTGYSSLYMSWMHSPDSADADFAGYRLERAPMLFGDYAGVGTGLVNDSSFVDDTIQEGQGYRYRLAAEDSSGNRSPWLLFQGASVIGTKQDPVIVVHAPSGPLYGPVTVDVDFGTDSYDPEGVGIDQWVIASPSIGALPATDGKISFTLQPGCHFLQFTVSTTDARFATASRLLKVYPQWDSAPKLVEDTSTSTQSRIWYPSMRFGLNGLPTLFGYERRLQGVGMWEYGFGDPDATLDLLPAYWPVDALTAPIYTEGIVMAASMDNRAWLAVFDYEGKHWVEGPPLLDSKVLALTSASFNNNFLFCNRTGTVDEDIVAYRLDNLLEPILIAENVGDVYRIGAVARESDAGTFLFVQTLTELLWYQLDFALNVVDSGQIAAALVGDPRMPVIDPVTDRPVLVLETSPYQWTAMDELGMWSAPAPIDNTEVNRSGASITTVDNIYCSFAYASGQARVYRFNGSSWDVHSVLSHSTNSGYPMAVMDAQVGERTLDLVDTTIDGEMRAMRITDDGSSPVNSYLPRSKGQGSAMHASQQAVQLHVTWTNMDGAQSELRYSNDHGDNWNFYLLMFGQYWTNGSDGLGQAYYSVNDGISQKLYYWDGIGLTSQATVSMGSLDYRPMLAKRSFGDDMLWYAFDSGTELAQEVIGHYNTGAPLLDYSAASHTPALRPVWNGVVNNIGYRSRIFARCGGVSPAASSLALYQSNQDTYELVDNKVYQFPADLQDDMMVRGRGLATCSYLGNVPYLTDQAFFSTYGADGRALRYVVDYFGNSASSQFGSLPEPLLRDERRTVSCETLRSQTGLMLMGDVEGRELDFQWSNFGDWESLPLPDGLAGKSMFELCEDPDGRWHIFYRDNFTDQIWMLSTL